jgi:hypothetical protein
VYKYRSEDYIAGVCNGAEQLQLEWTSGLDDSKGALEWTSGLDKSKEPLGWTGGLDESKEH